MANPSFGKTINPLTIDPETTSGLEQARVQLGHDSGSDAAGRAEDLG
jgi:hypothetical protein